MVSNTALAGTCSPGIPCTGYDIYNDTTSATSPTINGPKSGQGVTAGQHENGACDANFMNQIYSRAYMEASREVIMSQQLIHKPDSVLEYTCFDKFVSVYAENVDNTFSATTDWENREVRFFTATSETAVDETTGTIDVSFPDDQIDNIIQTLVMDELGEYINSNFAHTFLGEAISIDNDMSFTLGAGSYSCTHMGTIWNLAKCIDFGEDDRFRSFEHLVDNDPRSIPQACPTTLGGTTPTTQVSNDSVVAGSSGTKLENTIPGETLTLAGVTIPLLARMPSGGLTTKCPAAGGPETGLNTGFSNDLIRLANNCDISDTQRDAYSRVDLMTTYTELTKGLGLYLPGVGIEPLSVPGAVACADPIPTGLPVFTQTHTPVSLFGFDTAIGAVLVHYDHICPNPGCSYWPVKVPYILGSSLPTVTTGVCLPSPI